ncbi:unnamed protein product [Protopolystoma xenopodis]|uniref:Uncharacterized protein n=1 Tax=Protopolystoma xenopodis TaxID=117903 RepID=A0A3S5FBJ9_9PLAT|nr:unnamed protein product [Protopolystoma xenopodis]
MFLYLEELSRTYKRQMERLFRSFNLTTTWLQAVAESAEARERQQHVCFFNIKFALFTLARFN